MKCINERMCNRSAELFHIQVHEDIFRCCYIYKVYNSEILGIPPTYSECITVRISKLHQHPINEKAMD